MVEARAGDDSLAEMRRHATLQEYEFASDAPVVGGLVARVRAAWNSVATKWQVRPIMDQQTAFNRALVEWLERPPGVAAFDDRLVEQDRALTRAARAAGEVAARSASRGRGPSSRPRIAYFSPLPPARSGIAGYSAELLPPLAELADITLFVDDPEVVDDLGLSVRHTTEFQSQRHLFDLPLYQMGNSDYHESMYELLIRHPGVVVLHDYFMHHFMYHHTAMDGDWMAYTRELNYALDGQGRALGRSIRMGRTPVPLFELPMNRRLIDSSLGLIVHSRFAAENARRARPDVPLAIIPALVQMHNGRSRRDELGIPEEAVLFASFGQITLEKRIEAALSAFGRLLADHPHSHYLLVGEAHPAVGVDDIVAHLGLEERVHHVGYVADFETFVDWIHTADVVVNLRQPTVGETSAIALRAMAAARPLVVYDHGWYAEIPAEAALRVPPGDEDALYSALDRLAASAGLRRAMGEAGQTYIRDHCQPRHVAQAYIDFIRDVLAWGAG